MKILRYIFVTLAIFLVFMAEVLSFAEEASIIAEGECGASGNNITWTLYTDGLLKITGSGDMYYGNKSPWSTYCNTIKTVLISDGITSIGKNAFLDCSAITFVNIPQSITDIWDSAFYNCSSLTSIAFPDSLQYINSYSFSGCSSLKELIIPNSTSVGQLAFERCTSLTKLTIPANSLSFGSSGQDYNGFEYIFGEYSYGYNVSLTEITLTGSSVPENAFYRSTNIEKITLSDSIISIGNSAFGLCASLKSINIPPHLESIGFDAFCGCTNITEISLPDTLTNLGPGAFSGCSNLKRIKLPNTLIALYNTFSYCTSLEEITLPDSLTSIGQFTFENCISLTTVNIPNSVTCIDTDAFHRCSQLESINIPASVTYIGSYAFAECISLKHVYFNNTVLPDINPYSFNNSNPTIHCIRGSEIDTWAKSMGYECEYTLPLPDTSIILPASTIGIEELAFIGSAVEKVVLPNSCKTIGSMAFAYCSNLTIIYMPDSVTTIAKDAFSGSNNVTFICESNNTAAKFAEENGIYWEIE